MRLWIWALLIVSAWGLALPDSLVEGLYKADLQHFGRPSRWGRPDYLIVPYRDTYFASTRHGTRMNPYTFAMWEYKGGRWLYIFEVECGPGDPPDYYFSYHRATFARNGFSENMQRNLMKIVGERPFPADVPKYGPEKDRLYQQLRRAVLAKDKGADDVQITAHLQKVDGTPVALLTYYGSPQTHDGWEVWRWEKGSWQFWRSVGDPWKAGAEALWREAGLPAGLRSRLLSTHEDEIPY